MYGKIALVRAFTDGDGRRVSVDGFCYLALLKKQCMNNLLNSYKTMHIIADVIYSSVTVYKGG